MTNYNADESRSVLGHLRALIPERNCSFDEALRVAELQALKLLQLLRVEAAPVPSEIITELPRIDVQLRPIPMSGLSYWDGTSWIIALNRSEPGTRQRFTLLHEYKHIIDHGRVRGLYRGNGNLSAEQQAERAADYFAGCALMPRPLMKRAWASGLQTPDRLARLFETSERAISVRLAQLGLVEQTDRHGGSVTYQRAVSAISITSARESAA